MKKNAVISAIVLTIGIIFTSCGDMYDSHDVYNYNCEKCQPENSGDN